MTDLEDRVRTELAAWAEDAPQPRSWSTESTALELVPPSRRPAPRRWLAVAAAIVTVALVAAVLAAREGDEDPVITGPGLLRAELPVGEATGVRALTRDPDTGVLYVASENDARVFRIDPDTEAVTAGPALWSPDVVGAAGGSVYVILDDPVRVARLDGETFEELASSEITGTPMSARPTAGQLWVRTSDRELVRMDLTTMEALPEVPFDHGASFLAEGPAGVWLTDLDAGEVVQVDSQTGATLRTIELDDARGIAVGDDAVWVTVQDRSRLVRIDPDDGAVSVVADRIGRRANGVAVDGDRVWVTTFGDGRLIGIDIASGRVVTSVPVGLRPGGIVVAGDSVWVAVHQRASVLRLDRAQLRAAGVTIPAWTDSVVDVAGGALLLRCMGRGDTTVVLFPRDGADLGEWAFVQPEVAGATRACAFEPPTDDAHAPLNLPDAELAASLRAALDEAGAHGPYVLVASQGGGLQAAAFAQANRHDVTGLLLVDPGPQPFVDEIREASDLTPETIAEDPTGRAGRFPSAPQREAGRVVEVILHLLGRQ